jgi:hypothetical protein
MKMDHGYLNLPLKKRMGNIDKQFDDYKREQARAREASAKASRAAFKVERANAKRILGAIIDAPGLLDAQAAKRGIKRSELLALLKGIASTKPKYMAVFEREWLSA